jgi:hypothetical protein
VDASEVMKACKVDLGALKEHLVSSSTLTRTGAGDPVADRPHGAHHPVTPWSQTTWGNRIAFDSDSLGQNRPESGGSFPPRPYVSFITHRGASAGKDRPHARFSRGPLLLK